MRLKQIKHILENVNISSLYLKIENTGNSNCRLCNIDDFKASVEELAQLKEYRQQLDLIKSTLLYKYTSDELIVNTETRIEITSLTNNLYYSVKSLLSVLNDMYKDNDDLTISIKLPDILDLKELKDTLDQFDKILSQTIINEDIDGQIKVATFDNGTLWIDIFVGSIKAVALISSIAWSAAVICKKYQEARIFQEHVNSLKIKNESMEDLLSAQKEMTKALIDAEAINIYDKNYEKANKPEQTTRLAFAISTLADLMQKGAEIHPSLNAPETVQNLFPDMGKLDQIQSQTKQIEQKQQ